MRYVKNRLKKYFDRTVNHSNSHDLRNIFWWCRTKVNKLSVAAAPKNLLYKRDAKQKLASSLLIRFFEAATIKVDRHKIPDTLCALLYKV